MKGKHNFIYLEGIPRNFSIKVVLDVEGFYPQLLVVKNGVLQRNVRFPHFVLLSVTTYTCILLDY